MKKQNKDLVLTEREYFELEALSWKTQEFKFDISLAEGRKRELNLQLRILDLEKQNLLREMHTVTDKMTATHVKIKNLDVSRQKIKQQINIRLEKPENFGWGYHPDTLEIIPD